MGVPLPGALVRGGVRGDGSIQGGNRLPHLHAHSIAIIETFQTLREVVFCTEASDLGGLGPGDSVLPELPRARSSL